MPTSPAAKVTAKILVISSQVIVGRVGISIIAPAYAKLGIEGIYLPTLLLSSRPGLGTLARHSIPASALDAMLTALDADGRLEEIDGVLTGYFAEADQAVAVAGHLRKLRRRRPDVTILVDPVIGDSGSGLFVDETVAVAIRDKLLPLASIATPNCFELNWLIGNPPHENNRVELDRAARDLGPDCVVVTSASLSEKSIETRSIRKTETISRSGCRFDTVPNGTGDLFAGLFLGAVCGGLDQRQSLTAVCAVLETVAQTSSGKDWLDLAPLKSTSLDVGGAAGLMSGPDWVAGVDGCRQGWAVVFWDVSGRVAPRFRMIPAFGDILDAPETPRIVAVDMPIGLPTRVGAGGRGPESAVRPHLGNRQSSVFSIPSRGAVHAPDYRTACSIALETSTPPRKVSKQGFMLFEKIKQIDALMTPDLCNRVYEVHPELAFWRLNGGAAMQTPKKIKGRVNPDGIAERRAVLEGHGFMPDFFDQARPKGVAIDDFIDAGACAMIAVRLAAGTATPFPDNPRTDEKGITIAIWA